MCRAPSCNDSQALTCIPLVAGGGGTGIKDGPSKKADKATAAAAAEEEEGETFYDAAKKETGERATRTRAALDALDPEQRIAMEGHRPGAYLRLRFTGAATFPPGTFPKSTMHVAL